MSTLKIITFFGGYMLKRQLAALGFLCVICCLLAACGPSAVKMKVDSFNNPYLQNVEYKRFSFLPVNSENQPKEQHLFSIIKKVMEEKGFIFDAASPQFQIAVHFSEESRKVLKSSSEKPSIEITKRISITFVDVVYSKPDYEAKLVWQGEASSSRDIIDVDVEKCIIVGLLQAYPGRVNATSREVKADWCKVDK